MTNCNRMAHRTVKLIGKFLKLNFPVGCASLAWMGEAKRTGRFLNPPTSSSSAEQWNYGNSREQLDAAASSTDIAPAASLDNDNDNGITEEEIDSSHQTIPGEPGIDYPILPTIPLTNFICRGQIPGYYGDTETACQVSRQTKQYIYIILSTYSQSNGAVNFKKFHGQGDSQIRGINILECTLFFLEQLKINLKKLSNFWRKEHKFFSTLENR